MSYLTENPWPLIILLLAAAGVMVLVGAGRGKAVAGICVLAAIGVFFLEQYLISPGEEVEMRVEELLVNFKAADLNAIGQQISPQNSELIKQAEAGLELVDVSETFHIKSCLVTVDEGGESATAMVRANGNLTLLKGGGGTRHVPTYWKMIWKPLGESWKLVEVTRLNPANGNELPLLSAQ